MSGNHTPSNHQFFSSASATRKQTELPERFWVKVDKDGPQPPGLDGRCWLWTGAHTAGGYGSAHIGGRVRYTHRVAYGALVAPIPEGMSVLHRCDCRPCLNPLHLFAGTQGDNMRDMVARGRSGLAKLNWTQVAELRALARAGTSAEKLGKRFQISRSQAHRIISYRSWRPGPFDSSTGGWS